MKCVSFFLAVVYFEKHWSHSKVYAPQSSVHSVCEKYVLKQHYCSQIERRLEIWQLSVVHLANKLITGIIVYFSSLQKIFINVSSRYDHSVRTSKSSKKLVFGGKDYDASNFELKLSQYLKFSLMIFKTRQIWNQFFYNTSDFPRIFSKKCQILNRKLFNVSYFGAKLPGKNHVPTQFIP